MENPTSPATDNASLSAELTKIPCEHANKEKTIPKSIRISQSANDALQVLVNQLGETAAEVVSLAIIAYAKKLAAKPIVRFRLIDDSQLFALQSAANDIKSGISNLRNDLYKARKSDQDPEPLKAFYASLKEKYQKAFAHADDTLTKIAAEFVLHDLLEPSDHALLIQLIAHLENLQFKNRSQRQIQELQLKIFKTLIQHGHV